MKIKSGLVLSLFDKLCEKSGYRLDYQGFQDMAEVIGEDIRRKFLYEKYNKARKGEEVDFQESKLKLLLAYLDFKNLKDFQYAIEHPIPGILLDCAGVWKNYVRQNSDQGILFQSPVEIKEVSGRMFYTLRGPGATYSGEVKLSNGCLVTTFDNAENGKEFHHIYKIGRRKSPKVLQGIFSGMSTAGDPIGGRTVLIKTDKEFNEIANEKLFVQDLSKSETRIARALGTYYKSYERNNLRLNQVITYDWEDLADE